MGDHLIPFAEERQLLAGVRSFLLPARRVPDLKGEACSKEAGVDQQESLSAVLACGIHAPVVPLALTQDVAVDDGRCYRAWTVVDE